MQGYEVTSVWHDMSVWHNLKLDSLTMLSEGLDGTVSHKNVCGTAIFPLRRFEVRWDSAQPRGVEVWLLHHNHSTSYKYLHANDSSKM